VKSKKLNSFSANEGMMNMKKLLITGTILLLAACQASPKPKALAGDEYKTALNQFSGKWTGKWGGTYYSELKVSKGTGKQVEVSYCFEENPCWNFQSSVYSDNSIRQISSNGVEFIFTLKQADMIEGVRITSRGKAYITMKK
jgi:hypothetical protein